MVPWDPSKPQMIANEAELICRISILNFHRGFADSQRKPLLSNDHRGEIGASCDAHANTEILLVPTVICPHETGDDREHGSWLG